MLEIKLLGQFEVIRDARLLIVPTRNAQSLLAYLVIHAGKAWRREKLAGMLWPNSSEENARSNLRHELWRLRKVLEKDGEAYLLIDELNIAFNDHSQYSLDTDVLECLPLEDSSVEDLMHALSAYHGELLPGFYEEWVFSERERIAALFEVKMNRLLELLQDEGRWEEILEWAMRWIHVGHWPEPAYRALMAAYASKGDLPKAAATYERFVQGLQKDLGIKPSEQTLALLKRIKAGWKVEAQSKTSLQVAPIHKTPLETVPKTDPPLFALRQIRRSNLPKPLTSFIGREKEIHKVEHLVLNARLVTITGAGGVGKTRLAIQVARALEPQFKDGVWWIDLAPLFKGTQSQKRVPVQASIATQTGYGAQVGADVVAQAVSKALRVPESRDLSLLEGVLEYLYTKNLLLVVDNCEHLIEECAALAENVLLNCPEVVIIATSREALGVPGERAWLLPSLSLPGRGASFDTTNILQSEAVYLFIERAGDILPGYQPGGAELSSIVQICLSLSGIPLAIELAAARMNLLTAQEISARLDSRFSLLTAGHRTVLPRHKTLQAAIEWSYDLLSEPEQVLLRRSSVFAGSFTLEAAEAICAGRGILQEDVLTYMGRLVGKSLLTVEPALQGPDAPTRFRFLDTIRSFGRLKLEEANESQLLHDRHAQYFINLVENVEPDFLLQNQMHGHKLLEAEVDNLRAVIEWSLQSDQAESALRMVGALLWFWYVYGSHREACDLSVKSLNLPSAAQFREVRARALNTAGYMQCILGDTASARQSLEQAVSILKDTDDKSSLARSYQFLGLVYATEEKYDLSDAAFLDGLTIAEGQRGARQHNFLFPFLGDVELQKGDRTRATQIYQESAEKHRAIGNTFFLAYPLRRLGYLSLEQNDFPTAWNYLRESLDLNYASRDKPGLTASLTSMAALAIKLDKPILATRLYGLIERRLESMAIHMLYLDQAELLKISRQLTVALDEAVFKAAFLEGWELTEEQAIKISDEIYEQGVTRIG